MPGPYYLTEQSRQTLQRLARTTETGIVSDPPGEPSVYPTLAKATADVAKYAAGEFRLQANKPDEITDGDTLRTAYALAAIKTNDLAILQWFAGEGSAGFWAAEPLGTTAPAGGGCCCELLDLLQNTLTLSAAYNDTQTVGERIGQLQALHGCLGTVPCGACSGGEAPAPLLVTLSGIGLAATYAPEAYREAFSDAINTTHKVTLGDVTSTWDGPAAGGPSTILLPGLPGAWSTACVGLVSYTRSVGANKLYCALALHRVSDADGVNGRWGVAISVRYTFSGGALINQETGMAISATSTPASALWNNDCAAAVFADNNDITPNLGTAFVTAGAPEYWSLEIDGSQAATPPPPPPE